MKVSVIDIGSNSVRQMLWADGKTLYKKICTTRLGEGLSFGGALKEEAIVRSVGAVSRFVENAKKEGAEAVFAFATAAVRSASNGSVFVGAVKKACGLDVDVISGETEARIGLLGALGSADGGIIDVGGASTEITVGAQGKIIYAKSIDVGAVRLKDCCGEDKEKLAAYVTEKMQAFGNVPASGMYAVGGTATALASLHKRLMTYDPASVHGTRLTQREIASLADKLLSSTQKERLSMVGMEKSRADIIGGGALLMSLVLRKIGAEKVTVSERDNLEGYLAYKKERGKL